MKVWAYCEGCRHRHPIEFNPLVPSNQFADWYVKHAGHKGVGFAWPERSVKPSFVDYLRRFWSWTRRLLGGAVVATPSLLVPVAGLPADYLRARVPPALAAFLPNADIKIAYASSASFTFTLASLATSSTLVAGAESTAVSNTTNKYLDYLVGGKVTTGTTPTASKSINLFAYGAVNDTPTYPDVIDGTDSAETFTSTDIRDASATFLLASATDSTSNRTYWFRPVSIASAFGGIQPTHFGLWATHDTAVNLNSTGSNHAWSYTGVYATSA